MFLCHVICSYKKISKPVEICIVEIAEMKQEVDVPNLGEVIQEEEEEKVKTENQMKIEDGTNMFKWKWNWKTTTYQIKVF